MIATISLMAVRYSYAQQVPIPNPEWPLDSVVNGLAHKYTVHGDLHYADSSSFVWTVFGGTLYFDEACTLLAGNGIIDTVAGNGSNITVMWVKWDGFATPLDTGYVYVYEISSNGCQRSDFEKEKYQGMRIKVSAPPDVWFNTDQTIACSNLDSARVVLTLTGMPPYDLVYTLNGVENTWHIEQADLFDFDGDGIANNVSFFFSGLSSFTTDEIYVYKLIAISSGGVEGKILNFTQHTVKVHLQPAAPDLWSEWTQVTGGTQHQYPYYLRDAVNPVEYYWTLRDSNSNFVNADETTQSTFNIDYFSTSTGKYYIEAQYVDNIGCFSLFDTLNVEVFDVPTIAFSDSTPDVINCSASTHVPDEKFEFIVEYKGALKYGFTYEIYDYTGTQVGGGVLDEQTNRSNIISIPNTFVNDVLPEEIRPWKVVLTAAHNNESWVNVNILDSDIEGGRDERIIMIYPKPIILDGIDFAN